MKKTITALALTAGLSIAASPAFATEDHTAEQTHGPCTITTVHIPAETKTVTHPATYATEYQFAFKTDKNPNSPRWESSPNWNADNNEHSTGWHSTGVTRQVMLTPETTEVVVVAPAWDKHVEACIHVDPLPVVPPVVVPPVVVPPVKEDCPPVVIPPVVIPPVVTPPADTTPPVTGDKGHEGGPVVIPPHAEPGPVAAPPVTPAAPVAATPVLAPAVVPVVTVPEAATPKTPAAAPTVATPAAPSRGANIQTAAAAPATQLAYTGAADWALPAGLTLLAAGSILIAAPRLKRRRA